MHLLLFGYCAVLFGTVLAIPLLQSSGSIYLEKLSEPFQIDIFRFEEPFTFQSQKTNSTEYFVTKSTNSTKLGKSNGSSNSEEIHIRKKRSTSSTIPINLLSNLECQQSDENPVSCNIELRSDLINNVMEDNTYLISTHTVLVYKDQLDYIRDTATSEPSCEDNVAENFPTTANVLDRNGEEVIVRGFCRTEFHLSREGQQFILEPKCSCDEQLFCSSSNDLCTQTRSLCYCGRKKGIIGPSLLPVIE